MDTKVIKELQHLSYLSWAKIRNSSEIAGSFWKAYDDLIGDWIDLEVNKQNG